MEPLGAIRIELLRNAEVVLILIVVTFKILDLQLLGQLFKQLVVIVSHQINNRAFLVAGLEEGEESIAGVNDRDHDFT